MCVILCRYFWKDFKNWKTYPKFNSRTPKLERSKILKWNWFSFRKIICVHVLRQTVWHWTQMSLKVFKNWETFSKFSQGREFFKFGFFRQGRMLRTINWNHEDDETKNHRGEPGDLGNHAEHYDCDDPRIRVRESEFENANPRTRIREAESKPPIPRMQFRELESENWLRGFQSENPSSRIQLRESKSENPSSRISIWGSESENSGRRFRIRQSEFENLRPRMRIREFDAKKSSPRIQVQECESECKCENPNSRIRIREYESENPSQRIRIREAESENSIAKIRFRESVTVITMSTTNMLISRWSQKIIRWAFQ